jgi:hypothetical protein
LTRHFSCLNPACRKISKDPIDAVFKDKMDFLGAGMKACLVKLCVIKRPRDYFETDAVRLSDPVGRIRS